MEASNTLNLAAWRRWGLLWMFWTLVGFSFAGQFYISSSQLGRPILWRQALVYSLADWYVFAVLAFIPMRLARSLSLEGRRWTKNLIIHLLASLFFSLAYVALRALVGLWHGSPDGRSVSLRETLPPLFFKTWHFNLLIYWVIVSVAQAVGYYRKFQDRHLRTVELERSLAQAKLQALQMQLNPHFLFNSLHAIAELMHRDVDAADRMLTRLSELLRLALDTSQTQTVTLRHEIRFLKRYLEIEQTRFGERLTVETDIPEDTLEAMVPNLVLQPLVENCIRHGIEPQSSPGRILLRSQRQGDRLRLTVEDNGRGLPEKLPRREGIGLSNTRARLAELYGDQAELTVSPAPSPQRGVVATVVLPWSLQPSKLG